MTLSCFASRPALWARVGLLVAALALSGCAHVGYYWRNAQGHLAVMRAAKPVQTWLIDAQTPPALRRKLELSQRIRDFASHDLMLPDNPSYRRYADLKRSHVVWNVVAAPPDSLKLKTWCFAIVGCVTYRGHYTEEAALQEAARVKATGYEVYVYGVPAYSTLGYLNWLGGDPLLSTFIHFPEGELARLIIHELAHQVLYVQGDTVFNESFATAVERLGGQLWLRRHATAAARAEYDAFDSRRRQFRALMLRTRHKLETLYAAPVLPNQQLASGEATHAAALAKARVMQTMRDEYAVIKAGWGGFAGYDRFVAQANNASLGSLAAYDELVETFEMVFQRKGGDWTAFFAAISSIVPLPKEERRQALLRMTQ